MLKTLLLAALVGGPLLAGPVRWDLAALPPYRPERTVAGTIRVGGADLEGLVAAWEEGFRRYEPGVAFANHLPSSDVAMATLMTGTADVAASGREPALEEILGFNETFSYLVTPIIVATGAWKAPRGYSWSPVVFVNRSNPLSKLTMRQLDGIFGAERTGGYEEGDYRFLSRDARGPEGDIRSWGQLGLTGEWKDKPIQTYGYADTGMRHFFELRVFHGGDKWNPNYREYVETGTKMVPGGSGVGSHDMLVALSHDPYGIAWSGNGQAADVPGLKAIALARADGGPYFAPSERNCRTHDYPLSRNVFMYVNRPPGQPLDPKLREFLRFVLSRQGQEILVRTGIHLPLTSARVEAERGKLD